MKLIVSILAGLMSCYVALILASRHLGALSSAACSQEFTLPGIVCRACGVIVTLLFVPVAGLIAFVIARKLFGK